MNKSQGLPPVEEPLSLLEDLDQISPADGTDSPDPVALVQSKIVPDRGSLVRSVLFICQKCEGALVPASDCTVCKKTALRKCVKCGWQEASRDHVACKYLILLSGMRANRFPQRKKNPNKSM